MKKSSKKNSIRKDYYSKFISNIRTGIPLNCAEIDKACANNFEIMPKDLLTGLKNIKKLKQSKIKLTFNLYIKKLRTLYSEDYFSLFITEDNCKYKQYPAPPESFYLYKAIWSKKAKIDDIIKVLEIYLKNEKKPFIKKNIPDIGIEYMFNSGILIDYSDSNMSNVEIQKKMVDLVDRGSQLGNKEALYNKATNILYFGNAKGGYNPFGVAKATEELIVKYNDYRALCECGFANNYINKTKLSKYYKKAIKLGYCCDELYARLFDDKKNAMSIRKTAYNKYKKQYFKNKNYESAVRYGYSAYSIGIAILDDLIFNNPNEIVSEYLEKNKKSKLMNAWRKYIKEANLLLKYELFQNISYDNCLYDEYDYYSVEAFSNNVKENIKLLNMNNISSYIKNNYEDKYYDLEYYLIDDKEFTFLFEAYVDISNTNKYDYYFDDEIIAKDWNEAEQKALKFYRSIKYSSKKYKLTCKYTGEKRIYKVKHLVSKK